MAIFKSDSIKTPKYMVSFSEGLPGLRMKGTGRHRYTVNLVKFTVNYSKEANTDIQ